MIIFTATYPHFFRKIFVKLHFIEEHLTKNVYTVCMTTTVSNVVDQWRHNGFCSGGAKYTLGGLNILFAQFWGLI